MRCLEIGPGQERLPGFETLDIVARKGVDHVGDATSLPFRDATFAEVYSSHVIEHCPWWTIVDTVAEWARVLAPDGWLEIHTVDGSAMVRIILEVEETGGSDKTPGGYLAELHKGDPYLWAVGRLLNRPKGGSEHQWHRAIITPNYLHRCFKAAGLVEITAVAEPRGSPKHRSVNFGLRGRKP